MRNSFAQSGFHLLIRFVCKTDNAVEEIGFSSAESNPRLCCFLASHINELRIFARWILKNNADLFSFLEESALDLPNLIGTDFYRNKIKEVDPSYQSKQKFLQDLGIETESGLSEAELETIGLIVNGHTASQIGKRLFRSKRTIEHRIENIKSKWNCSSRVELVQKARELQHFGGPLL